jgi:hypothetical protein
MASHGRLHHTVSAFLFGVLELELEQVRRWVGSRTGLDVTVKRTIPTSADMTILRQHMNFTSAVPAAIHEFAFTHQIISSHHNEEVSISSKVASLNAASILISITYKIL